MMGNFIRSRPIILTVLILIGITVLPVLIFELGLASGSADYSWPGVRSGSLTNLCEKQLFNAGFTLEAGPDRSIQMCKSDTLQISGNQIPVRISVLFQLPLYGQPGFRQPEKMIWQFPLQASANVISELRNAISESQIPVDPGGSATEIDTLVRLNKMIDLYAYDLDGKKYYFTWYGNYHTGICEISTEIFYGKLFLMLKYYVSNLYHFLPASLTPHWYGSFAGV